MVVQLLHIFSPAIINETKLGMNRSGYHNGTVGITPVGITGLGFSDLVPSALDIEIGTTWNYLDNLTITRGRHTWKVGAEIRRIWLNNSGEALPVTTLTYASNQNLINNVVDSISLNGALGVGGNRRTFWMGSRKKGSRQRAHLALNLGVRYEYYGVMHEVLGRPGGGPWVAEVSPRVRRIIRRPQQLRSRWLGVVARARERPSSRRASSLLRRKPRRLQRSTRARQRAPLSSAVSKTWRSRSVPLSASFRRWASAPRIDRPATICTENWDFDIQQHLPRLRGPSRLPAAKDMTCSSPAPPI